MQNWLRRLVTGMPAFKMLRDLGAVLYLTLALTLNVIFANQFLFSFSLRKREEVKARSEEVEDPDNILIPKCMELAAALRNSHHLVVYTGAGISTAAKIPDYRGSNGIWTLLQQGKDIGYVDMSFYW